jgi:hypothetical protein
MNIRVKFVCVFITMLFLIPATIVLANNNIGNNIYYRGFGSPGFYTLGFKGVGVKTVKKIVLKPSSTGLVKSPFKGVSDVLLDDLDQSQEQSDGFYKIYGDRWYAQSFIPSLTKAS